MPLVHRPTFNDELLKAGVTESRFSLTLDKGKVEFLPDVPDEEQKKILAVLAAHDGPLSEARHQALEATDAEAGRRIADPFGKPPDTVRLAYAEINRMAGVLAGVIAIIEKAGLASVEEMAKFGAPKEIWATIQAIRDAEAKAKAALLGAKSVEEVQGVKVGWPGD
jgi:hypothetical protein